jgi:Domain of unknown function (DUF4278)
MKLTCRGIQFIYRHRSGNTGKPERPAHQYPYVLCSRGIGYIVNPNAKKPPAPFFPNGYDLIYRGVALHVTAVGIVHYANSGNLLNFRLK